MTQKKAFIELIERGALEEVTITPQHQDAEYMARAGRPVPRLRETLLIDTGARHTLIEQRLAEQLGIRPEGRTRIIGVSLKPEVCLVYPISIELRLPAGRGTVILETTVAAMPTPFHPVFRHGGLLGRDFLKMVRLVYDGPSGSVRMEILPEHHRPVSD